MHGRRRRDWICCGRRLWPGLASYGLCDERFLGDSGTPDVRYTKSMGFREFYVADDERQPCIVQFSVLLEGSECIEKFEEIDMSHGGMKRVESPMAQQIISLISFSSSRHQRQRLKALHHLPSCWPLLGHSAIAFGRIN